MQSDLSFIKISHQEDATKEKHLLVRGTFNISYENDGLSVIGENVLNHIVLVVTRGGNYHSSALFSNTIVFGDDIKKTKDGCSSFFNFNLFEKTSFQGKGNYYILCSLGTLTSNILNVRVDHT